MEQTPRNDSEESSKKKKTAKIARALPIGVQVETDNPASEPRVERPRLSINERFIQQMQEQAEKRKADEVEAKKDDDEDDDDEDSKTAKKSKTSFNSPTQPADQQPHDSGQAAREVAKTEDELSEVEDIDNPEVLDAANWGEEGEFSDAGEIPLSPRESSAEDSEEFVPVPEDIEEAFDPDTEAPVEPELLDTGLATEVEPDPVEDDAPETSYNRILTLDSGPSPWYNAAAADREARERRQQEEDARAAEKRGLRHGLASGLLFGWLLGRRGKKKAAVEHAKETKQQNERIKALTQEQALAAERLGAIKRTQEQIESNIRFEGAKPTGGPENKHKGQNEATIAQKYEQNMPEAQKESKQRFKVSEIVTQAAAELIKMPEKRQRVFGVEKPRVEPEYHDTSRPSEILAKKFEKERAELAPEDREITEESYQVPEGRRVETSAWHRIEVDAKTGKVVDNPEVAYGQEFKREQKQEVKKEDSTDAGVSGGGSSGVLSGLAAAAVKQLVRRDAASPYPEQSEGGLEVPRQKSVEDHLTAGAELLRYASMPIVWAAALIVVLGLLLLGILR